ncbi:MAG: hypothetical protein JXA71_03190, partial [Chitinispirillaceae bacterium]|nr:hypothetical protein [Chitinispirillaceae bacterium]
SPFNQENLAIASDSAGGAIITWEDKRNGADGADIYAQRIKSDGSVQWGVDGAALCVQTADQRNPRVIWNIMGWAMITWQDKRTDDYDIYVQRLDTSGTALFTANGVAVTSASGDQTNPQMVDDGAGGAIILWQDLRSTIDYNIFAQRIGATGAALWAKDGLVMNNNRSGDQRNPVMVTDGNGGAIIVWEDKHGTDYDIYGQRVNSSGGVEWISTGVSICTAPGDQVDPRIVRLYRGGADIAWVDHRAATSDIYLQRITAGGVIKGGVGGMAVASANGSQTDPVIISDRNDGSIVTWKDFRNNNNDIYTQIFPEESIRVRWNRLTPSALSRKGSFRIDRSGTVHYKVETAGQVSLVILDLSGRPIVTFRNEHQNPGSYSVSIPGNHGRGAIPCGVYFCTLTTNMNESVQRISIMR